MSNQYTEQSYYQQQYGQQQQQPQQPANNMPKNSRFSKKVLLIIAVVVMGVLALGLLVFLLFRGEGGEQPGGEDQYMFIIDDENSVPKNEFDEVYSYYLETEEDEEVALERAKNIFIDNYVLRNEYFERGNTLVDLSDAMLQIPQSGSDAPTLLRRLTRENSAISEALSTEVGVESRSGNIIDIRISEVGQAQKSQLTALATRKLLVYRSQLLQDTPFTQVENEVENDPELATQSAILVNAGEFTNISRARLPLPGESFENVLFNTPEGRVSNIFNTEVGGKTIYGIVQVTDSKEGEYEGYQQWYSSAKSNIIVEFNYQQSQQSNG